MSKTQEITGWGGKLQGWLEQVATRDAAAPSNVVEMPRTVDVNALLKKIRGVTNEQVSAEADRGKLDLSYESVQREYADLVQASDTKRLEIIGRLRGLQEELAGIAREHGVKADVLGGDE